LERENVAKIGEKNRKLQKNRENTDSLPQHFIKLVKFPQLFRAFLYLDCAFDMSLPSM